MNYETPAFVLAFAMLLPVLGVGLALLGGMNRSRMVPLAVAVLVSLLLWWALGNQVVLGAQAGFSLAVFYGLYLALTPVLFTAVMPRTTGYPRAVRRRLNANWLIFVTAWTLLVQFTVAAWVLNVAEGWLTAGLGLLDFGGASVLYLGTAAAGLAWLTVSRRRGPIVAVSSAHRAWLTIGFLWAGSFAVTVGSEAVPSAMVMTTALNTLVAPVGAFVAWGVVERIRHRRISWNGAVRGVFAGLVAITAAADVVSPLWAGILGLAAGALASALAGPRGSVLGLLLTQLSAAALGVVFIGILGEGVGGLITGNWALLGTQFFSVGVISSFAFVVAAILAFAIDRISERIMRPSERSASSR